MLSLKDTVPARSFPVVNWLLIAANVVLFLVELSLGPDAELLLAWLGADRDDACDGHLDARLSD